MSTTSSNVCLILLAIILPPVAVLIKNGCSLQFIINILLTLLGHIPGLIHAIYIVLKDYETKETLHVTNNHHEPVGQNFNNIPQQTQTQNLTPVHKQAAPLAKENKANFSDEQPPPYSDRF